MRLIAFVVLLFSVLEVQAVCRVFIPERDFYHAGYTITFNFDKLLGEKNYIEVFDAAEADLILNISGNETEGRMHKAVTSFEMGETRSEGSVTCLTQLCGIADFARSFNKVYKSFDKKLPVCQN